MMSAALAGACSSEPDPKELVSKEFESAQIDDVNIDYDRSNRVLHLKGEVDSQSEKTRAEEIATRVVGTSGSVANELTVVGMGDNADDMDGSIRRELNAKVENDMVLEKRDINFDVNNGVVTIKGEVMDDTERQKINEMAKATPNVKDVVNALTIDPNVGKDTLPRVDRPIDSDRRDAPARAPR
jgi:osmotically-inducible protein OsmY